MTERLRIAILHWPVADLDLEQPGGVLRVELSEAEALHRQGHHVRIFGQNVRGVHPLVCPLRDYRWAGSRRRLVGFAEFALRTGAADVIHGCNAPMVARRFPHRALLHFHNPPQAIMLDRYDRLKERYAQAHYAFLSQNVIDTFRQQYPAIPAAHCHALPNGVDANRFRPLDGRPSQADGVKRVLFVGAWSQEKGIDVLAEAIRILAETRAEQDYIWQIGGSTGFWKLAKAEAHRIDALIESLAARFSAVEVLGPIQYDHMPGRMAQADIFVMPSVWPEPFGLTNVEAMACGTPVIASAVGGIPEIVTHEHDGLIVPPGDPGALAQAVSRALDSDEMRRTWGTNARRTVEAHFTWDAHIQNLLTIYRSILRR